MVKSQKDLFNNFNKTQLIKSRTNLKLEYIVGSCGVGKTTIINTYYKKYKIITINDINNIDNIINLNNNSCQMLYNKEQYLVVIDNVEKINDLNYVHEFLKQYNLIEKFKIIIVISIKRNKQILKNLENIIYINKISDIEIRNYILKFNKFNNENMEKIINKIDSNLHKLEFILNFSKTELDNFINDNENIEELSTEDILIDIFDNNTNKINKNIENNIRAEPQLYLNNIYTNLLNLDNIDDISIIFDIIIENDSIGQKIYSNNYWEMYDMYAYTSPIQCCKKILNMKKTIKHNIQKWNDISYNFKKSKQDMELIIYKNNIKEQTLYKNILKERDELYTLMYIIKKKSLSIIEYVKKNKKGKNISKDQKIELFKDIKINKKNDFDELINYLYNYGLYNIKDNEKIDILITRIQNYLDINKNQKNIITINNEFIIIYGILEKLQKNKTIIENDIKNKIYENPIEEMWF